MHTQSCSHTKDHGHWSGNETCAHVALYSRTVSPSTHSHSPSLCLTVLAPVSPSTHSHSPSLLSPLHSLLLILPLPNCTRGVSPSQLTHPPSPLLYSRTVSSSTHSHSFSLSLTALAHCLPLHSLPLTLPLSFYCTPTLSPHPLTPTHPPSP